MAIFEFNLWVFKDEQKMRTISMNKLGFNGQRLGSYQPMCCLDFNIDAVVLPNKIAEIAEKIHENSAHMQSVLVWDFFQCSGFRFYIFMGLLLIISKIHIVFWGSHFI